MAKSFNHKKQDKNFYDGALAMKSNHSEKRAKEIRKFKNCDPEAILDEVDLDSFQQFEKFYR